MAKARYELDSTSGCRVGSAARMKLSEFQYEFPSELIAVSPQDPRSSARMMVVDRYRDDVQHKKFSDLPAILDPGDVLVVNESVVLPARFKARRKSGGYLEGLYLESRPHSVRAWLKGKVNLFETIQIDGFGEVEVLNRSEKEVELRCDPKSFVSFLKEGGILPVPPYIRNEREARGMAEVEPSDREFYQTVFANQNQETPADYSVASPTASLHFDEPLLNALHERGVRIERISLYVGEGTFAPVMVDDLDQHEMHAERCSIASEAWVRIQKARRDGRRVIAVGTTALRTLEAAALRSEVQERIDDFWTRLFIRPPFKFKIASGLITNFHWPQSTLIVLLATFIENGSSKLHHRWRSYYELAIRERYRLFSYGDGMLIL